MENSNTSFEKTDEKISSPDQELINQFRGAVKIGCGIFSIIFAFFAVNFILYHRDIIILFLNFFEIQNISTFSNSIIETYEITTILAVVIAIFTVIFVYIRFFSNIQHHDFGNDMGNYLQFYQTLFSTIFDISILIILFLYLILIKQSLWEFLTTFFVIGGLALSILKISSPYSKIIQDHSALELMNSQLNEFTKKTGKEMFSSEESISEFLFYGFIRKNTVWITMGLLLSVIVAILGFIGEYNILTLILLELMIIRYCLFQSQVSFFSPVPLTLYLDNSEILDGVFIIREDREHLIILTRQDDLKIVMKAHMVKADLSPTT